jgi:hypothetical protein
MRMPRVVTFSRKKRRMFCIAPRSLALTLNWDDLACKVDYVAKTPVMRERVVRTW